MVSGRRKESGTGREAKHLDGVATHRNHFGTVGRDVGPAYFTLVFREHENFFMSGRIPDDRLSSVVPGHDPSAILGNDDGKDPDTRLHGWTLLLSILNLPPTNITTNVSSYDVTFVRKGDWPYITLGRNVDSFCNLTTTTSCQSSCLSRLTVGTHPLLSLETPPVRLVLKFTG